MGRRAALVGGVALLGAAGVGAVAVSRGILRPPWHQGCGCVLPPLPTPAAGVEPLRDAVEAYARSQNLAATVRLEGFGVASRVVLYRGPEEGDATAEDMGAFLTGLHAEVTDEITGGEGLSVHVDLRWAGGDEDQVLTAGLTSITDSARLEACVAIAVPVLVDGAGQVDITDDTLSCYLGGEPAPQAVPDGGGRRVSWMLAAPANLPTSMLFKQVALGRLTATIEMRAGGDLSALPIDGLSDKAWEAGWTDLTVRDLAPGASVLIESGSEGRSGPLQVADVRGVLEQARSGSWARRIIFRGDVGTDDPGAAFDCADGALSVPDPMPSIDRMPLSAELSEGLLRDLG